MASTSVHSVQHLHMLLVNVTERTQCIVLVWKAGGRFLICFLFSKQFYKITNLFFYPADHRSLFLQWKYIQKSINMCSNDAGIIIKGTYCWYGAIKIEVTTDFCYKVSYDGIYVNGWTDEVKMNEMSPGERKHIVYDLDFYALFLFRTSDDQMYTFSEDQCLKQVSFLSAWTFWYECTGL